MVYDIIIVENSAPKLTNTVDYIKNCNIFKSVVSVNRYDLISEAIEPLHHTVVLFSCPICKQYLGYIDELRQDYEHLSMIATIDGKNQDKIIEYLKAGITGFFEPKACQTCLKTVLEDVVNGGAPMSSKIAKQLVQSFWPPNESILSKRENQVLQLLVDKKSYAEIATVLSLSINTVKTHVRNIYQKMNVSNRDEVIKLYEN